MAHDPSASAESDEAVSKDAAGSSEPVQQSGSEEVQPSGRIGMVERLKNRFKGRGSDDY